MTTTDTDLSTPCTEGINARRDGNGEARMTPRIERRELDLLVTADAYPGFAVRAKALGGTVYSLNPWTWSFSHDREAEVREFCRQVYGHDGEIGETVTCLVAAIDDGLGSLCALGRHLAIRHLPLEAVTLGRGVSVVRGGFPSTCGRGRRLHPDAYTVLEVRDVPAALARREAEQSLGKVDVVGETDVAAVARLRDITNALSARTTGGALEAVVVHGADGRTCVNVGKFTAEVWPGYTCVSAPWVTPEWYPRPAEHDVATRLLQLASYGFIEREGLRLQDEEAR